MNDFTRDVSEEKIPQQSREALKELLEGTKREKQYEAIVSSTPDLMYVVDRDYRLLFANDALLEVLGRTPEETLGRSFRSINEDSSLAGRYEQEIDQVFDSKQLVQGEDAFHHENLGKRFYHYIISPVLNDRGEVEAVAGTTRDISEHKQVEQALKKNEEKYRTLVENFPSGAVGLFDESLRYTAVGGELIEAMGVNPAERIGKKITDIYPAELLKETVHHLQATLEGQACSFETEFQNRHLLVHTLPILDNKEKVDAGMLVVQDVSERRQAQKELQKSEEKYRTLFERMDEGFCIIQMMFDDEGEPKNYRYLETNPAYHEHTGLEVAEGDTATDVLPAVEEDTLRRNGRVALTGESYHKELYVKEVGRWLELSAFRVGEPDEHKVAVLIKDINDRKQAQDELKAVNENLEKRVEERTRSLLSYQDQLRSLASRLSKAEEQERHRLAAELHDNLGQMLAVNKMKMDLLKKGPVPPEITHQLEEIQQGMNDAIVYTRDLMSDLKPPPTLDKEDVTASIQWLADKMKKHDLTVRVSDDGQAKKTEEEIRSTLLQSVREVLFNIVKHAGVSEARVSLSCLDNQIQIVVEDEGQGFDPGENDPLADKGGFGLFNIYERMDLLGARMEIDSEPGVGTTVTLTAPLKEEKMEGPVGEEAPDDFSGSGEKGRKIEVMIVDDHQMFREGLKKIVETENDLMVVAEAGDGREAIELARKTWPEVIVMDVDLPEVNGIKATREILSSRPEIRVIGLSSLEDQQEIVDQMYAAGASAFLSKEEAFETLCATVRSEATAVKE